VMNLAYAASSYPAGYLSDRVDRRLILAIGGILLMIADIVLARTTNIAGLVAGISLWGLHMGFSQGMLAAMVADASVSQLRGTAFGLFSLISGVALLAASSVAGVLWNKVGPQATFYAGASFAGLAALMLLLQLRGLKGRGSSSGTAHS
jgi:MFS family permease